MKTISILVLILFCSCGKPASKESSIEMISESANQTSLFNSLVSITDRKIPEELHEDSLAFLILPVQASCPGCRKKTIDSIIAHQFRLLDNHYIIISASGGFKTLNSYFLEEGANIPTTLKNRLFLDSTNKAFEHDLYYDKPTIYYTYNKKAYKKVAAIPSTVREDLREFFSGYRNKK